jgi:hypothetical protein
VDYFHTSLKAASEGRTHQMTFHQNEPDDRRGKIEGNWIGREIEGSQSTFFRKCAKTAHQMSYDKGVGGEQ